MSVTNHYSLSHTMCASGDHVAQIRMQFIWRNNANHTSCCIVLYPVRFIGFCEAHTIKRFWVDF